MASLARRARRRNEIKGMSPDMMGWSDEDRQAYHRMVRENMRGGEGRMKRTAAGRKAYRDMCAILKAQGGAESAEAAAGREDRPAEAISEPSRLPLIAGIATAAVGVAGLAFLVLS